MDDVERLLSIIHEAPLPFEKTDAQLAQEYRNWFYGVRTDRLKATERRGPKITTCQVNDTLEKESQPTRAVSDALCWSCKQPMSKHWHNRVGHLVCP